MKRKNGLATLTHAQLYTVYTVYVYMEYWTVTVYILYMEYWTVYAELV